MALKVPYDKTADARLVKAVRRGDTGAFGALVEQHKGLVFRIALRMTGNPDTAGDLAQDVFVNAFESLRRLKDDGSFRSWLISIAINRCRDWHKDIRRNVAGMEDAGIYDQDASLFSGSIVNPYEGAILAELGGTLERALRLLRPIYREAVMLKDVEGMSYEEMAGVTGVNVPNLKIRVVRGRGALREILREWKVG